MVIALVDFDGSMMVSQPAGSSSSTGPLVYLSFRGGEYIRVIHRDPSGWWDGEVDSRRGWFPSNYVKPLTWDTVGSFVLPFFPVSILHGNQAGARPVLTTPIGI